MATVIRNRVCRVCGSDQFTRDLLAPSGDVSCMNCGSVVEENPIVSEVQFGESASGAAMVQGAMVGADQARANFNMRNAMESREQTLLNAKKKIRKIASVMRIPDYIVDSASGWFKLALVQNFVQGRRSQNVIAACLYVACRHEKTHHLLIDFSSRLQISVYSLGSTYLKLVRALQIQKLPIADPSLFIQHFADRLLFGERTAKVCKDATKLAHRMSLDWIYEGRRPAGIAGACVLLAARMNKINRSHAEIVAVARVGEETIQKRLNEFKSTDSGKMKLSDFRDSENSGTSMPPSYEKNRKIEEKIQNILLRRRQTLQRFKESVKNKDLIAEWNVEVRENEQTTQDATSKNLQNEQSAAEESSGATQPDENGMRIEESQEGTRSGESQEVTRSETAQVGAQDETTQKELEAKGQQNNEPASGENPSQLEIPVSNLEDNHQQSLEKELVETAETQDRELEPSAGGANLDPKDSELFVSEDEDFGYDQLPEDPLDETYQCRSSEIALKTRNLRSRTARLDSISKNAPEVEEAPKRRRPGVPKGLHFSETELKRESSLLKAVLDGGTFKEHELEQTLDRFLKMTDDSLAKAKESASAPRPKNVDLDDAALLRRIEKNRPRNLVTNNDTTAKLLSNVRDDRELDERDDDDYTRSIVLLEKEREEKERIWIAINYDFLIAQEKKRLKVEADELTGNTSGQPKKRRKVKDQSVDSVMSDPAVADALRQIGEDGRAMTPAESAKQIFHKKSFSRKINYGSITELFNT